MTAAATSRSLFCAAAAVRAVLRYNFLLWHCDFTEKKGAMKGRTKTGLEILLSNPSPIKGKRVGVVVNQTATDRKLRHLIHLLQQVRDARIARVFSPEHGLWGAEQDQIAVESAGESELTIPVTSLYGETEASLRPAPETLEGLDALVFDIQDVGARYYTFIYTMAYCMEAAKRAGIEMLVLDRPNPINGVAVEGNILRSGFESFVGRYPIAVRHGMTAGELAELFNREFGIGCRLEIIRMQGWTRKSWFDQTGLPWIPPSPNMPTLETAAVYPGMCLIEGTNLSEGRGTTKPFELAGAPFLDSERFAKALNDEKLPGIVFRPASFKPSFHKWAGKTCGGVQLHVTERDAFKPYLTGIAVARAAKLLRPNDFAFRTEPYEFVSDRLAFDILTGTDNIRSLIERGVPLATIEESWLEELEEFKKVRESYLLY